MAHRSVAWVAPATAFEVVFRLMMDDDGEILSELLMLGVQKILRICRTGTLSCDGSINSTILLVACVTRV